MDIFCGIFKKLFHQYEVAKLASRQNSVTGGFDILLRSFWPKHKEYKSRFLEGQIMLDAHAIIINPHLQGLEDVGRSREPILRGRGRRNFES